MSYEINSLDWWFLSGYADSAARSTAVFALLMVGLIAFVVIKEYRNDKRDGLL